MIILFFLTKQSFDCLNDVNTTEGSLHATLVAREELRSSLAPSGRCFE